MTCAVPGCKGGPEYEELVTATRTDTLGHLPQRRLPDEDEPVIPPGMAQAKLCPTHRAEFERLGWLAPREEDDAGD